MTITINFCFGDLDIIRKIKNDLRFKGQRVKASQQFL